jgi:hypothetical protein
VAASTASAINPGPTAVNPTTGPANVHIVHQGNTTASLRIDPPADGKPFWLVLGQSHNAGWTARVTGQGGHSLGAPVLVDGYANGWQVTPQGSGPINISLVWTPQKRVDLALGLSALAVLGCLTLAFVPWRRPQWLVGTEAGGRVPALPVLPVLSSPMSPAGRQIKRRTALAAVLLATILGAVVIAPLPGLLVGLAALVVLAKPRWRGLLSLGAVALFSVSALYVVQLQLRYHFPAKLEWPEHFDKVALIPWIAVAFLMVDSIIEHLRSRRRE